MGLISKVGIVDGQIVYAETVYRIIDALSAISNNDVQIWGNLNVTGSNEFYGNVKIYGGNLLLTSSAYLVPLTLNSTASQILVRDSASGLLQYRDVSTISGSGGGTPGGVDTNIQFNSGSTFSGSNSLTFDYSNKVFKVDAVQIRGSGSNVFIGTGSGVVNVGNSNVGLGYQSLILNTSGSANIGVGALSLNFNTTGSDNIAVGYRSLFNNTGNRNVAIGTDSFFTNTTGTGSVAIGYNAGYFNTSSNVLIIANSNTIQPLIYGDFSNNRLSINKFTGSANANLDISGSAIITGSFNVINGNLIINTGSIGINVLSPSSSLHISESLTLGGVLGIGGSTFSSGSAQNGLLLSLSGGASAIHFVGTGNGFSHEFRTNTNNATNTRLKINDANIISSVKVGIGSISVPSASFHVSGAGIFTSNLAVGINNTGSALMQVRGVGTTTANSFLIEDNNQTSRFAVFDNGTASFNGNTDITGSLVVRVNGTGSAVSIRAIASVSPTAGQSISIRSFDNLQDNMAMISDGAGTGENKWYVGGSGTFATFWSSGVERMRIAVGGFVGIGLTVPSSSLHIKATDTGSNISSSGISVTDFNIPGISSSFRITNDTSSDTTFIIDNSGRISSRTNTIINSPNNSALHKFWSYGTDANAGNNTVHQQVDFLYYVTYSSNPGPGKQMQLRTILSRSAGDPAVYHQLYISHTDLAGTNLGSNTNAIYIEPFIAKSNGFTIDQRYFALKATTGSIATGKGNIGINQLVPSASLHIIGSGSGANSQTLWVQNSNLSSSLIITDNGSASFSGNHIVNGSVALGTGSINSSYKVLIVGGGTAQNIGMVMTGNSSTSDSFSGLQLYTISGSGDTGFRIQHISDGNGNASNIIYRYFTRSRPTDGATNILWQLGDGNITDNTLMSLQSAGLNVGFGTVGNAARLHVRGRDSGSSTNTVRIENAVQSSSLVIRDDGKIDIGVSGSSINMTGSVNITGSLSMTTVNISPVAQLTSFTGSFSGSQALVSIATGSFNAAFIDYFLYSGSNGRAGVVNGGWINGTSSFNEAVTTDIGNTSNIFVSMSLLSASAIFSVSTGSAAGTWQIKLNIRTI
jgi:hypothetical protein